MMPTYVFDAGAVDAIVMATAALLGAVAVTADADDFDRLSRHFPSVIVLSA